MKVLANRFLFMSALAILSLFTASKTVIATDAKIYPGTMCRGTFDSDLTYGENGEVANASSRFGALLVCPIVRDSISGNPGIERVMVHVRNTARSFLECFLHSFNGDGTLVDTNSKSTRNGGLSTLSIGPVNGGGNAADGYYVLDCNLSAANSAIISYRVNEAE
jgi:hypothetical protein